MSPAIVNVDDLARKVRRQQGRVLAIFASLGFMAGGAIFGNGATEAGLLIVGGLMFGAACLIRYAERRPAQIIYLLDRPEPEDAHVEFAAEVHNRVASQDEQVTGLFERLLTAAQPDCESA